jgi:hypothetical protein
MQAVGADRLAATLRAAGEELGDLTAANTAAAQLVADRARPGMPHRTGRLVSSVRARGTATEAVVSVTVPYARMALFGAPRAGTPAARVTPYGAMLDSLPELTDLYTSAAQAACDTVKGA